MWRMAGWLAKTVAAGLIISFLSIWTTGYIVNSYVETLLKQFNIPLEQKPFALSSVWGGLWGADPVLKSDADSQADRGRTGTGAGKEDTPLAVDAYSNRSSGALTDIGGGAGPKGNSAAAPGASGGNAEASAGVGGGDTGSAGMDEGDAGSPAGTNEENAGALAGTNGGENGAEAGEALREGVAITTEELNETKSGMSEEDKELMFNVMMKKLPQEAWQYISGLMEGGLTTDELTEVQQLIAQHLDRDEYDQMMKIMKKY
ncbi:hypothetical protein K0T92_12960 [Paenibacillus oenotherae]|uniref:Spore coat protein n=1 Tax=Paenibacillus oenotherae TaxID=1435645 RepID=A0ABS7D7Z0_9BACL|nr:hypothetical protein [Paenibacillus oenotherae]MBW7475656.1 hypothetical protein [Paenibacillus oenotherae]